MKDIMTPGVIDDRVKSWNHWHTNSSTRLTSIKAELHAKLDEIEDAGNYNADMFEVTRLTHAVVQEAQNQLHAIGWSAEDYQDLQSSRTFRFIMKLRDLLKK